MRLLCTWLAFAILACTIPGCGGSSEMEKTPEVKTQPNPQTDMPGFKEMQDKLKK